MIWEEQLFVSCDDSKLRSPELGQSSASESWSSWHHTPLWSYKLGKWLKAERHYNKVCHNDVCSGSCPLLAVSSEPSEFTSVSLCLLPELGAVMQVRAQWNMLGNVPGTLLDPHKCPGPELCLLCLVNHHPPLSSVALHVSLLLPYVAGWTHLLLGFCVTCSFLARSSCSFFHANSF